MPRDVQELLRRTADAPSRSLDTTEVIGRARRRTLANRTIVGLAAVAAVAVAAGVVLPLVTDGEQSPEIAGQPEVDDDPVVEEGPDTGVDEPVPPAEPESDGVEFGHEILPLEVPAVTRWSELDVPVDLDLRLVGVARHPLDDAVALVDLGQRETTVRPTTVFGGEPIDAVALSSSGVVVVARRGMVTAVDGDESRYFHRSQLITAPGAAPSLTLVAADDDQVWVVQVGVGDRPGGAELLDIHTGEVVVEAELPPDTHPVAAMPSRLVLNQGWEVVLTLTEDGQLDELTEGEAVAAPGEWVAVQTCETPGCELTLHHVTSGERREVAKPVEGTWVGVAGPTVPTAGPRWWPAATSQGRLLYGIDTTAVDGLSAEDRSGHLVVIDVDGPEGATVVWDLDDTRAAAWSHDGRYIVLIDPDWETDADLTILDTHDGSITTVPDAIPVGHVVLTAR